MRITMTSELTGAVNDRDIPVTEDELRYWLESGIAIQDVMPHLSADDREFLMTGITPAEWNEWKSAMRSDDE